jgi:hypothetical protein
MGTTEDARKTLALRGIRMDCKVIRRLASRLATRGLEYRTHLENLAAQGHHGSSAAGKRLVIGTDGGRVRTRVEQKRGRPRKSGRRGFDAPWREPKVLVIYEVDEQGRKKKEGLVRYDITLRDADGLFAILVSILCSIGAHQAAEWIIVGDGAGWIWNRIERLVTEVGFDIKRVSEVVDFYHATQRLFEIADTVKGWTDKERKRWVNKMRAHLRQGLVGLVIDEATQFCRGRNARKLRSLIKYFRNHESRMAYAWFRKRRIPIGSGAVESCVRRVINLRAKGNGIFWEENNVEEVLHLRAQLLSGHWEQWVDQILQPKSFWDRQTRNETRRQEAA